MCCGFSDFQPWSEPVFTTMTVHTYSRIVILAMAPFHTWQDWPFIVNVLYGKNCRKGLVCLLYMSRGWYATNNIIVSQGTVTSYWCRQLHFLPLAFRILGHDHLWICWNIIVNLHSLSYFTGFLHMMLSVWNSNARVVKYLANRNQDCSPLKTLPVLLPCKTCQTC